MNKTGEAKTKTLPLEIISCAALRIFINQWPQFPHY